MIVIVISSRHIYTALVKRVLERYSLPKLAVVSATALFFARYFFTPLDIGRAFLHGFVLVVHEAGHLLMQPFGELFMILGGTLWQLAVPLVFALYFTLTRQPFSAALLLFLVAFSLVDTSVYVGDARARSLPLLSSDVDSHDWWNMLNRLELLPYDTFLARLFYLQGLAVYLLALYTGLRYARKTVSGEHL